MKIRIVSIEASENEELVVYCHPENKSKMLGIAEKFTENNSYLSCKRDGNTYKMKYSDIYYIEVVDDKLFLYGENDVYESKLRLYEVEQNCPRSMYFRASKSMLVNIDKIEFMKPSFSGKFEINLTNGEKILVSRKYVSDLKRIMEV